MSGELQLSAGHRVLVLAPHPDDETLAAGDLIRASLAAGCELRVAFATDGDNNPWPQRWLERRWKIGARERARWGARRRGEARTALERLGLRPSAPPRFFGWPDQGLTSVLMRDDRALEALAQEIADFAPTHLVLPTLADRHPDHSALRVLAELALLRNGHRCLRLGYVVHGEKSSGSAATLDVATSDARAKQEAMLAHASQIALSRRRLMALAALPNRFELDEEAPLPPHATRLLHLPRSGSLRPHELLLLVAWRDEIARLRLPLPRAPGKRVAADGRGREYAIDVGRGELRLTLPEFDTAPAAIYAKAHRCEPRLLIFDREPWRRAADLPQASSFSSTAPATSGR